jgi:choline dehydrogenase
MDLDNDHVVPPGTKGHGFGRFLDISVNGPEYPRNQSDAETILATTAKNLGQPQTNVFAMVARNLNNNDADRDQQLVSSVSPHTETQWVDVFMLEPLLFGP